MPSRETLPGFSALHHPWHQCTFDLVVCLSVSHFPLLQKLSHSYPLLCSGNPMALESITCKSHCKFLCLCTNVPIRMIIFSFWKEGSNPENKFIMQILKLLISEVFEVSGNSEYIVSCQKKFFLFVLHYCLSMALCKQNHIWCFERACWNMG